MNILLGFGLFVAGMFFMSMLSASKISDMQGLIDASRKALANAEDRVEERNKLIKIQVKQIKELKAKITDLKNNIELLVNNSKNKKIKELVTDRKSEN